VLTLIRHLSRKKRVLSFIVSVFLAPLLFFLISCELEDYVFEPIQTGYYICTYFYKQNEWPTLDFVLNLFWMYFCYYSWMVYFGYCMSKVMHKQVSSRVKQSFEKTEQVYSQKVAEIEIHIVKLNEQLKRQQLIWDRRTMQLKRMQENIEQTISQYIEELCNENTEWIMYQECGTLFSCEMAGHIRSIHAQLISSQRHRKECIIV
jgi:hypothetical protein